ncbi:MAG: acyl-CoA reductase, partial [Thermoleophilia bacterium]|nr:acyl-CoA reductase [Thermoleophilia bacterium]
GNVLGMPDIASTEHDRHAALNALDGALEAWLEHESFRRAVAETCSRAGYSKEDVEFQLRHVVERCRAATMRRVLNAELGVDADLSVAPETVLVLASGGVPGLVIEGIAAAFAIGAKALVRPSRDETVLHHLLRELPTLAPSAAHRIEIVGVEGEDPPWERAEAAIVFGSDSTISYVRDHLPETARTRVAGYGSRQGIAVIAPGAGIDTWWAEHLADDVLTFRQRGCMSPSWIYVVGSEDDTAPMVDAIGRELATARDRHLAPGVDDSVAQRRANDADVLGAIAAGMAPDATALYAGDARLTVVRVPDVESLRPQVGALGSLLQTAVVVADDDCYRQVEQILSEVGCTRIVLPGEAHEPDPLWPQDGIGRVAPLLGQ